MADDELTVRINAQTEGLNRGLKKAGAAIAAAFTVDSVINFGRQVLQATAEFEKMGAVLGNTLGSVGLAKLKLKEIEEFAARTPFGVNELTNSFVKLANQGFKPTGDQMRSLGDLAASTGKSFDQLAEAIIDAQVGEFERLKEFGVRAKDAGDKVIFTFKGVQTTVDKSSEAIRNYVTSLGNAEGVSGSMATISQTLTGKISNLGDAWDQMLISVGSNTSGVFSGAIDVISESINAITQFNNELETASKFKIKGNAFETFVKYARIATNATGPVANFATTQDILVQAIQRTENSVSKLVSGALEGAKSTNDFGNSIAKLKTDGDKLIKGTSNLDLKAAYKKIYEEAIKTLQDGRANFAKEASKPAGANFGTVKGTKDIKSTSDILKTLDLDLLKIKNAVDGTFGDAAKEKVNAFKKAIDGLTEAGASPGIIKGIQAQSLDILEPLRATIKPVKTLGLESAVSFGEGWASAGPVIATNLNVPLKKGLSDWQMYVNGELLPQIEGNFKAFFDQILINGKVSFDSLGKALLNTIFSILASDAAKQVTSLFSAAEPGVAKKGPGGIFGALGSLFKVGGKAAAGTAAAGGTAVAGTAGATAATGGLLLPILGGLAVGGLIASLFKKKPKSDPAPAPIANYATSGYTGATSGTDSGRVVFEISGTNLIGVLNRAGAKLQRATG
jgi:hypothetical protein